MDNSFSYGIEFCSNHNSFYFYFLFFGFLNSSLHSIRRFCHIFLYVSTIFSQTLFFFNFSHTNLRKYFFTYICRLRFYLLFIRLSLYVPGKKMDGGSSISRRTRSRWDEFYRSRYNEIKKKPDEGSNGNGECDEKHTGNSQNFETKDESFVEKGVADSISIEDSENSMAAEDSDDSEKGGDDEDNDDDSDKDYKLKTYKYVRNKGPRKVGKKKARVIGELDFINMLVDSRWKESDLLQENPAPVKENNVSQGTLPLKFRFEDDQKPCLAEKTDWEMEIDSLFGDLEMGLWESEVGCRNSSTVSSSLSCL